MTTIENPTAEKTSSVPAVHATIIINSAMLRNLFCAMFGAGAVVAAFMLLQHVGHLFAAVMPFVGGGILFVTLVSTFFMLLRAQKTVRRTARLRISLAEAYTAASIFVVMGYFATACMHAFQADGLAMALWTNGVWASGLAICGFGLCKFCVMLWNEGK